MALARNFGGTDNHVKLCDQYFGNVLKMYNNHNPWTYKQAPVEQLIDTNLKDPDARHLMVIGKRSLYDLWNQNYIVVGSKDNVKYFTRVALGAYANPML
ncbi:hypothetical protein RhiirA5_368451, partial [Rhizophagus irregularis]